MPDCSDTPNYGDLLLAVLWVCPGAVDVWPLHGLVMRCAQALGLDPLELRNPGVSDVLDVAVNATTVNGNTWYRLSSEGQTIVRESISKMVPLNRVREIVERELTATTRKAG